MTIEQQFAATVRPLKERGPLMGFGLFGSGVVLFWQRHMEHWDWSDALVERPFQT